MGAWRAGEAPVDVGAAVAWEMTREILRDPRTHSYAAIAGWNTIPRDADILTWAVSAAQSHGRPPWTGIDPLRREHPHPRARQLADRDRLRDMWNIHDTN